MFFESHKIQDNLASANLLMANVLIALATQSVDSLTI